MTRSRKSAKDAGQKFERLIADHLRVALDNEFIDIRPKNGRNDRGDIGGIRHNGEAIVLELKDYGGSMLPGTWIKEAEVERGNDDALIGAVVVKRKGTTRPGDQFVLMTVDDLTALLTGERPDAKAPKAVQTYCTYWCHLAATQGIGTATALF